MFESLTAIIVHPITAIILFIHSPSRDWFSSMPDTAPHPTDAITFDIDFDDGETLHVTRLPSAPGSTKACYTFVYDSDIDDNDEEPDILEFNNDRTALKALEGELYPSSDVVNPRVAECLFIAHGILPDDSESASLHISTKCKNGITVDTYRNVSKRSCSVSYIVDVTDIVNYPPLKWAGFCWGMLLLDAIWRRLLPFQILSSG